MKGWIIILFVLNANGKEKEERIVPDKFKSIAPYLIGLQTKRKAQLGFVLNMAKNNNHFKMAKIAFDTVVTVRYEYIMNTLHNFMSI